MVLCLSAELRASLETVPHFVLDRFESDQAVRLGEERKSLSEGRAHGSAGGLYGRRRPIDLEPGDFYDWAIEMDSFPMVWCSSNQGELERRSVLPPPRTVIDFEAEHERLRSVLSNVVFEHRSRSGCRRSRRFDGPFAKISNRLDLVGRNWEHSEQLLGGVAVEVFVENRRFAALWFHACPIHFNV